MRGWCRVGLRTTSCWRIKLIYGFVGLFTGKNPVMLVFMFLNETKAAHLFERCESEFIPLSQCHGHRIAPALCADFVGLLLQNGNGFLPRVTAGGCTPRFAGLVVDSGR